jgi:hypothetical protein
MSSLGIRPALCFHLPVSTQTDPTPAWVIPLCCVVTALGMTWPVWFAAKPSLIGHWEALDLAGSVWAHWWTADALSRGVSPFVGTHSFSPIGLDPVLQYNLMDAILGTPWVWLAGPRVGYNLAVIAALVGTGLAGVWLARGAGCSRAGALLCGLSIESSSYLSMELYEGRISQATLLFWLLGLGGLVRLIRGAQRWPMVVLTGTCAAAAAGVYWYHGMAWILAAAILIGLGRPSRRTIAQIGTAALLGLLLVLPALFALIGGWDQLPGVHRGASSAAGSVDDLKTGYQIATEHGRWPLWPLIGRANQTIGHQLSWVGLGLAVLAVIRGVPGRAAWLGIGAVGWVLALGPVLQGWTEPTTLKLPFHYLQAVLPTFDRMWWPQRFELLSVVGVGVLSGLGLDQALANRGRRHRWLLLAIGLVMLDAPIRSGVLPLKASEAPVTHPDLYEGLQGALLTVPVLAPAELSNRALMIQTQHGQPVMHGDGENIPSHRPAGFTEFVMTNSLLEALHTLHTFGQVEARIEPEAVDALLEAGFVWAVADPAVYPGPSGKQWATTYGRLFKALFGPPHRIGHSGGVWRIRRLEGPVQVKLRLATGRQRQVR